MPFPKHAYISSGHLDASSSEVSPAEIMDQALKEKKMSSASVRRRKFHQRERQNELEQERYPENKRRIVIYDDATDDLYDARDNSPDHMNMNGKQFDRESSVETPSERSVLTPDEPHPHRATFGKPNPYETNTELPLKIETPEDEGVLEMALGDERVVVPPSPRPVLQASLASWADFRYDRYSMVLDSPVPSEALSADLDIDESFSPVETATPISFRQPKTRPSLISIVSISKGGKRRNTTPQSPLSQELPQPAKRPARRPSSSSSHSGFPAAEATLFEIPDLPANAIELIANASQESLPLSASAWKESKARTLRRSNVPRLSIALNHARMSSIKNLIKTPTSATHSRTFSHASSHHSRPSTASISGVEAISTLKSMAFSNNAHNFTVMTRPSTAMSTSSSGSHKNALMTALPSLPTPPAEDNAGDDTRSMQRKKSFSNLRRRSESIGQAIKGLGRISTKHDVPMPPALPTPKRQLLFDHLAKSPTPPLPSPRTGTSSMSAGSITSDFTRASSGGNIGLGLRNV